MPKLRKDEIDIFSASWWIYLIAVGDGGAKFYEPGCRCPVDCREDRSCAQMIWYVEAMGKYGMGSRGLPKMVGEAEKICPVIFVAAVEEAKKLALRLGKDTEGDWGSYNSLVELAARARDTGVEKVAQALNQRATLLYYLRHDGHTRER